MKKGGPLGPPNLVSSRRALEDRHIGFVADEPHLRHLRLLGHRQHLIDHHVASFRLGLQVEFRDRVHLLRHVQILAQLDQVYRRAVPQHRATLRDDDLVLDRIDRRRRLVALVLRQVELHRMGLRRDGDDEHDEKHQHDVDQRRRVDIHHRLAFDVRASGLHCHGGVLLTYSRSTGPPAGGCEMKPTRAKPARCMVNTVPPMHLYGVLMSPRICTSGIFSSVMFSTPPTRLIWSSSALTARSSSCSLLTGVRFQ